jgi:hypothetical protein
MKSYLGRYIVNQKVFFDKIEAILEAQKTLDNIIWDFHWAQFNKIDWSIEPKLSLPEMYKLRAQQIRDQYDYVIIMFSGGADSTNVLYSFLDNNIRVDEIVSSIPTSGLRDFKVSTNNISSNNASEWLLTTIPALQKVSISHPDVKISINDFFQKMLTYNTDDWLYQSSDWIHPSTVARYNLEQLTHIKKLADQGKKIAVIYGCEKPQLAFWEGKIISRIFDLGINVPRQPFDIFYPNVDPVLFYSTPEMPQILIKQSHEIVKAMYQIPHYQHMQNVIYNYDWNDEQKLMYRDDIYQRSIVPIIYPSIRSVGFQARKSTNSFMSDHDDWFYSLHKDTRLYQLISSDADNFFKTINSKYFKEKSSDRPIGFKSYSNGYILGTINNLKKLRLND